MKHKTKQIKCELCENKIVLDEFLLLEPLIFNLSVLYTIVASLNRNGSIKMSFSRFELDFLCRKMIITLKKQ